MWRSISNPLLLSHLLLFDARTTNIGYVFASGTPNNSSSGTRLCQLWTSVLSPWSRTLLIGVTQSDPLSKWLLACALWLLHRYRTPQALSTSQKMPQQRSLRPASPNAFLAVQLGRTPGVFFRHGRTFIHRRLDVLTGGLYYDCGSTSATSYVRTMARF